MSPIPYTIMLEPTDVGSEKDKKYKQKVRKILKNLQGYDIASVMHTAFLRMLNELDMM